MKKILVSFLLVLVSVLFVQAQEFPQDGSVYRLVNTYRENAMLAEDYGLNELYCMPKQDGDCRQLWKFIKSGDGWNIQNIFTGRFVQNEEDNDKRFSTAERIFPVIPTAAAFFLFLAKLISSSF